MKRFVMRHVTRTTGTFKFWSTDHDGQPLLLDPPYQRGNVWGVRRRQNLIRSIVSGVPIGAIILNDRFAAGWQGTAEDELYMAVIDGRQRVTTLLMFMDNRLRVPAGLFDPEYIATSFTNQQVSWECLSATGQKVFRSIPVSCLEAAVATIEEERELFELVNYGGLSQGEVDEDMS